MNRLLMIAALILALGVTWQIQRLLSSEPSVAATLEPGVELPTALSFPSERCWVGYFVDPNCPFCRDLMAQAHDRDDLRWIIGGEEPLIDSLLGRFPVNPQRVRRAAVEAGRPHPFHNLAQGARFCRPIPLMYR